MRLANVIGTVIATSKDAQLVGSKLLLTNVVDSNGKVIEPSIVAVDTVGAGVGDKVLLVEGSSARIPSAVASMPVDACVIAVVDTVSVATSN
ncbi:MAG: ethanolamine utilization protein EutN [Granulosicoccus sp.]|jgi:ethanolamine utilization protein EutN